MYANKLFSKFFNNRRTVANALLGTTALTLLNQYQNRQKAKCCGIVGILSTQPIADKYCLEGIELLQNRGYDSAGIVTFDKEQNATLSKLASNYVTKIDCIDSLKEIVPKKHKNAYTGIGHTRWATCGGKTDENAHPHFDQKERVFIIHNGTLEDILELRKELNEKGITLRSETDTELIAQFIGLYLDEGIPFFEATKKTMSEKLKGTWGLLAVDRQNPDQMIVCRNGSPIQIGLHEDSIFIASERIAFEKYTQHFIPLKDGEMVLLDIKNRKEFYANVKDRITKIEERAEVQLQARHPYKSFFAQEIDEQPEALLRCMGNGSRLSWSSDDCTKLGGLERHVKEIQKIENMVIVACGTSYYAGQFALKFFRMLGCFNTIQTIEASEFTDIELPREQGGAIFISQSGETRDIYQALQVSKKQGLFTMGVINVVGSLIATNVHCGVYSNTGREVAVPATKSFTSQIVSLLMVAIWISYNKDMHHKKAKRSELKNLLRQIPVCFGETLRMVDEPCKRVAQALKDEYTMMILGKGAAGAIAKEGALKIKEVTYIHAEAFISGEMKHGPIALINSDKPDNTKIMLMVFNDETFADMELALSEVKSRNAFTIVITDCPDRLDPKKVNIMVPIINLKELTPLLAVIVFQKVANEICLINNLNPDKPRNLAKTVTVG